MFKKIIWVMLLIAIGAGGWYYWEHYEEKDFFHRTPQAKSSKSEVDLEQKVLGFTIDGRSSNGVKQWHLEGESAVIEDKVIHLNVLAATAYGQDVTVNLTSDKGIYYKDQGEVELIGNVKVVSDDGLVLTTDRARWSQTTKEIFTESIVNIKREELTAVGKGGMANSEEKWAILKKDVVVKMRPDTIVSCDGLLKVKYSDNRAIFHDNVIVVDKGGKLFSDLLTVEFDPETRKIKQVTAEGNVKVKRGKSYTLSEKAIYTESTKSAKLLGRPRIIIDPQELEKLDNANVDGSGMGSLL